MPRSFVVKRGDCIGRPLTQLTLDVRHMMEPYTAVRLRERRCNALRDFVAVAGPIGVSHMLVLSRTDVSPYLRIARLPHGPTLTLRITRYALTSDVIAQQKRPHVSGVEFKTPPLLILNNFSNDALHLKLTATMLQSLFPPINVYSIRLSELRRCLLFNFDPATETIECRHYAITAHPVGLTRGIKRIIRARIPDLSRLGDISEFVLHNGNASDSEFDEAHEDSRVALPQDKVPGWRGNRRSQQSAIKLHELGPRMTLRLVKIQEGLFDGDIIYHSFSAPAAGRRGSRCAHARRQQTRLTAGARAQSRRRPRRSSRPRPAARSGRASRRCDASSRSRMSCGSSSSGRSTRPAARPDSGAPTRRPPTRSIRRAATTLATAVGPAARSRRPAAWLACK